MDTCPISESLDGTNRPETPSVLRAAGIRLPHDQSAMDLGELQELLDIDIRSNPDTYLDEVDLLTEAGGVFPNSKLPFEPTITFLEKLSLYDTHSGSWKFPKESMQSEEKLADFLNNICENIHSLTGHAPIRRWNSNFCNTVLEGSPISRKPDIVLVDTEKHTPITWPSIRAIAEVTTQEYEPKRISNTVTDKSYIILTTQPDRVFVPVLSFWGNLSVRLTVTDRQGQLRSQVLKLGVAWRVSDSIKFVRLLIGLCFTAKPVVGYDPTMLTDDWDRVVSIICDDKKFKVINVIFESQSLVGRATRVWEVEFEGKRYILKDAWVEVSRPVPEYRLLAELQGIKGVPQLFCGADVRHNNTTISTGLLRDGLWGDPNRVRIRRRTVTSSVGAHIASFCSKRELISVLRDITVSM
jgi:hypothetical protein